MVYRAPVHDIVFTMRHAAGFDRAVSDGLYEDMSAELATTVLEEAGRFANDVIAPLNRGGDEVGVTLKDGAVTTAPGWKDAYRAWTEPQAGSDLAAIRSRAERAEGGTYRIKGQKIFITYGEHDLTDNIIHLVL